MDLRGQMEIVRDRWECLEIEEAKFYGDITLITAKVEEKLVNIKMPVYFIFFKNFIVVAGDCYEWVFDCNYETNKNGKPSYSSDPFALVRKVSCTHKKHVWDYDKFKKDVEEWLGEYGIENKNEYAEIIIDNYSHNEIEDSIELIESLLKEKGFELVDQVKNVLTQIGNAYDYGLVTAIGCLIRLKELIDKE